MKTDLYTKTVLTVIAGVLIILAFENSSMVQKAYAEPVSMKTALVPVNNDGSMNVRIINDSDINVNIQHIDHSYVDYPLYVKVKQY